MIKFAVRKKAENIKYVDQDFLKKQKNIFFLLRYCTNSFKFLPKKIQEERWTQFCYCRYSGSKLTKFKDQKHFIFHALLWDKTPKQTFKRVSHFECIENDAKLNGLIHRLGLIPYFKMKEDYKNSKNFFRGYSSGPIDLPAHHYGSLSRDLLNDEDFIIELMNLDYEVYNFLLYYQKKNDEFVKKCIRANPKVFTILLEKYRSSKYVEYLMNVIIEYPNYIYYHELKNDVPTIKIALTRNRKCWDYLDRDLHKNEELKLIYFGIGYRLHVKNFIKLTNINFKFN